MDPAAITALVLSIVSAAAKASSYAIDLRAKALAGDAAALAELVEMERQSNLSLSAWQNRRHAVDAAADAKLDAYEHPPAPQPVPLTVEAPK